MSLRRGGFLSYLRLWQMFVGSSLVFLVRGEMKTFTSPCSTFGVYCITDRGKETCSEGPEAITRGNHPQCS